MKILYIASIRLPTEKAHGVQIMKTCEAFSQIGKEVKLIVPNYSNRIKDDPFEYYEVKKIFSVKKLIGIRLMYLGKVGFFLENLIFFLRVFFTKDFWETDYVYSRDEILSWLSNLFGRKTIWETHTGSYNFFAKNLLKKSELIVCISQGLKDFYISKGSKLKIIVAHDGVDLDSFKLKVDIEKMKKSLGLPMDKKIIMYAGRLDGWKGTETFISASKSWSDQGVSALGVVVGGNDSEVVELSRKWPTTRFLRFVPYKELVNYLKIADVLVVPNTAKSEISSYYTSPLKVFAYMASGVPIVASDLPSIREILNQNNSILIKSDNADALIDGVKKVLEDSHMAGIIANQALLDVKKYTWLERAKTIISNI